MASLPGTTVITVTVTKRVTSDGKGTTMKIRGNRDPKRRPVAESWKVLVKTNGQWVRGRLVSRAKNPLEVWLANPFHRVRP